MMILDKVIEKPQSNLKIVVNNKNGKLFECTIGELSTQYATIGQREAKEQPYYDTKIGTYRVEII